MSAAVNEGGDDGGDNYGGQGCFRSGGGDRDDVSEDGGDCGCIGVMTVMMEVIVMKG